MEGQDQQTSERLEKINYRIWPEAGLVHAEIIAGDRTLRFSGAVLSDLSDVFRCFAEDYEWVAEGLDREQRNDL